MLKPLVGVIATCYVLMVGDNSLCAQAVLYSISQAADAQAQNLLWEINPSNGAVVQQYQVSLPRVNGLIYGIGGLTFAQGNLWAVSQAADAQAQNLLWEINPSNGAVVHQFQVSLPRVNGLIYGIGGLTFAQGNLWAISQAADAQAQNLLWEINPSNGAVVHQFQVSLPRVNGLIYGIGGLTFAQGNFWAISQAADAQAQNLLWEINPANGTVVHQFQVNLPRVNGLIYGVGGLTSN